MPIDGGEWEEHLEELRRRIISVLAVFSVSAAVSFALSEHIVSFLTDPVSELEARLYYFSPAEKFTAYLYVSAVSGAVVTAPFFILETALFIWPALKAAEKRRARFMLISIPALFLAGAAAAYRFLAPAVMSFFLSFGGKDIEPLWSFREYLSLLISMMMASGMLLELPPALLALCAAGVLDPARVSRARPYVIILIFFLAGVFTPPDVTSQVMLGVPLYLLFEGALFLARIVSGRK
ncbi:MAG: twin-arginine translocase subunit TatC [Synergistaceae bacterium]|jgi:sec-independent protein translocase protein TatC|nr:twin-arginine translocase subunit TatC [Synergistaceae bacterium]